MTEREAVVAWLRAQSEECWARAAAARVAKQPNRSVVQTAMSDAFLEAAQGVEQGHHMFGRGQK